VFVFTGDFMEPWVDGFLEGVKNSSLIVADAGKGVDLLEDRDHDEDEDDHNDDKNRHAQEEDKDPHIWLDPVNAQIMVDAVAAALTKASPENAAYFEQNARAYKEKLEALHRRIVEEVSGFTSKTILYAGHFAFGYFAKRYGLDHVSPYAGFSPNAEPTPGRIVELTKKLRDLGLSHIFYEELVEPRIAEVIGKETGARLLLLHGAHNISKKELEEGTTYLEIMEKNLENLRIGLK
jgi:zinc transport system substrate-binding protein